jgi:hypothetical protein
MIWPAAIIGGRLRSVVPITAGLAVEWLTLWRGFGLSWRKAIVVDVVMNAISAAVGAFAIPLLGLVWEVGPGSVIYKLFDIGMLNPISWSATFAIAVLTTTAIEAAVVKIGFKISLSTRRVCILLAANSVSVGLAFVSIWTNPRNS